MERNDILQNLFDLSLRLNGRAMLFELINKAQLMLSDFHQKSQESLANENKLYEEMLREQQEKIEILEQERENEEKERMKLKEVEKKKRDEYFDLMNMDEDKENKLRLQWLEERENEESEDFEEESLEILKKYAADFPISEKDLLLINLIKSLMTLISKIKGFNLSDFLTFIFKEIKKLNLIENNEVFKLIERKSPARYERLLSEKLGKYKESLHKGSEAKYGNFLENLMFGNITETIQEDLLSKRPEFFLDYSNNPISASATIFSKTISTNDEKIERNIEKSLEKGLNNSKSRYQIDFEEIASIGKGSFGEVIKAKNRLDGRYYAIKKIKIYQGNFLKKIMREVQTLSLMHHQNVLRYYQAWIEEVESDIEKIVRSFLCFFGRNLYFVRMLSMNLNFQKIMKINMIAILSIIRVP